MILTQLSVNGFKNLQEVQIQPHPNYNLILGENAQGKTNLIESIWILTGCRSFRGTKEKDYLAFEGKNLQIEAKFQDTRREQTISYNMASGSQMEKKIRVNGVVHKPGDLFSLFHCVIFTPEDLSLVNSGPEKRRSFLDMCGAQLHAPLLDLVRRYQLALQQRNAVLKEKLPLGQTEAMLKIWDVQLARLGAEIAVHRAAYVRKLSEVCVPLYHEISGGREEISLHYQSNIYGREAQETIPEQVNEAMLQTFTNHLIQSRQSDILFGHTSSGIHRDDLILKIGGKYAKDFGSQGQKKSIALALKLAQAQIYHNRRKESPIILLDDVMGELDASRQGVVSGIIQDMQVFVTTCHPESVLYAGDGAKFLVYGGKIKQNS